MRTTVYCSVQVPHRSRHVLQQHHSLSTRRLEAVRTARSLKRIQQMLWRQTG